jgi:hypothetical protein
MAFDTQIQALVGTATQTEMDQWMADGVREIINILPPHLKEYCYSKQTFTSAAANSEAETMITGQLGSVYAGSVECRQIRPMDKHKASTSGSLEYASSTDPVYYIEGNKINILPASSSGVFYVVANPSIDASAVSTIDNFPNEAEYLVVLYAAIKVLQNKMNEKSGNLPDDIPVTILSTISTDLPSYTSVDSFISVAPPSAPTMSAKTVTLSGTVPIFIPPIFLGEVPTYTSQVVAPDFGDANIWLNTEEDSEMVSSRVQVIQAQLQEYQANMQNEMNKFNKENVEYQASMQKYSTDTQNALNNFNEENVEYQANLQKDLQDAQLSESKEGRDLQKYSQEITSYQAQVQTNVQKFQSDLAENKENFQNNIQKYSTEIQKVTEINQSNLSKYSQDLANYNAKIQKQSVDYQWYQGQYTQLKQDYNQGIQMLVSGGMPQQQKGEG